MFQIVEAKQNDIEVLSILNKDSGESISIVPRYGANVNRLILKKGSKIFSILDGNNQLREFQTSRVFNNAKMLPFPNRIKDGVYIFEGEEYYLEKNCAHERNAIHGLLFDKNFELHRSNLSKTFGEVILTYNYNAEVEGFPFKFITNISFKLDIKEGFYCQTEVINNGTTAMPFGEGWHPYFNFGKKVDSLHLKFLSKYLIDVDERLIPTGKLIEYDHFHQLKSIQETNFDSCFKLMEGADIHKAEIYDPANDLVVNLWQQMGRDAYNYLQVYIPPDRMSLALEPMTCNINAFNNNDGLIVLKPGQKYQASYGVYLS